MKSDVVRVIQIQDDFHAATFTGRAEGTRCNGAVRLKSTSLTFSDDVATLGSAIGAIKRPEHLARLDEPPHFPL